MQQMSDEEAIRLYNQAKNKKSQIGIIAELNACEYDDVVAMLEKHGINAPKKASKKKTDTADEETLKKLDELIKKPIKDIEPAPVKRVKMPEIVANYITQQMVRIQEEIDIKEDQLKELNDFMRRFQ